jgi:hypothetical protein
LSCILDIVDLPEVAKDSEVDEDDFRRILDWCDIWIILLKTTGKSKSHFSKVFFWVSVYLGNLSFDIPVIAVYRTCS